VSDICWCVVNCLFRFHSCGRLICYFFHLRYINGFCFIAISKMLLYCVKWWLNKMIIFAVYFSMRCCANVWDWEYLHLYCIVAEEKSSRVCTRCEWCVKSNKVLDILFGWYIYYSFSCSYNPVWVWYLCYYTESEAKPRTSVNNKCIIWIYLEYNLHITQRAIPINASFVE